MVIVDIEVNQEHDRYGQDGIEGTDFEHDDYRRHKSGQRNGPFGFEGGTVRWGGSEMVEEGDQAERTVGHHEKHGDDASYGVHISEPHEEKGDETTDEEAL